MTDLLIARLGETPAMPVSWATFSGARLEEANRCPNLPAFGDIAAGFGDQIRVAAILPGETVALRTMPSPPKSLGKFRSAAELLLEDELAEEIEALHIAVEIGEETGRIFAIKHSLMVMWVSAFRDIGTPLHMLTPDFDCLGGEPDRPVLFVEKNRILAASGQRAFAADSIIGRAAMKSMIADHEPKTVGVYGPSAWTAKLSADLYEELGPATDETLLQAAAVALSKEKRHIGVGVNLLQGDFRPPRAPALEWSRWKRPAAMAAALSVAFLALQASEGFKAARLADRYTSEAQRLHNEYFPDAANVNPRTHARAILSTGRGAMNFMLVANRLSAALEENDAVAIDRIRFDATRGQFTFSIRSDSDSEIQVFKNGLTNYGLTAQDLNCCRQSAGVWIGDMAANLR